MAAGRITSWRLGLARLDYFRPVHWAAHSEDFGDSVVLEFTTSDGVRGAAEAISRPKWHDMSLPQLQTALRDSIMPVLGSIDWRDGIALEQALAPHRHLGFACALADQALWDIRAQEANTPLWRLLGAASPVVRVSATLTRTTPAIMAKEAAELRAQYGFDAFKVKTGQGIKIDRQAIADIRRAVGGDVLIMADSNRAHAADDVAAMSAMLAEAGVVYFEDPCAFTADESFVAAREASVLPILVDNQSRSFASAETFLGLGAQALSVKTMKTGITESLAIAVLAGKRGAKVAAGISASGGAGAITTLSLAAALPPDIVCLPSEETFFLYLKNDLIGTPLQVRGGRVDLSNADFIAPLIDWGRLNVLISN